MTRDNKISRRLVLTLLPMFLIATVQPAEAGLLGGGSRPKGSSGGLLSPAEFNCIYDDGYTVEIRTDTLQKASPVDGALLPATIQRLRAVIQGSAECTTTTGAPAFEVTAEGSCDFNFAYTLSNTEPACEDAGGGNSSKTYALQCPSVDDPSYVTGTISCKRKDLTNLASDHPCFNLGDEEICGVNVGITPTGFPGIVAPATDCDGVFGNESLFEITQYFVGSSNCGFDTGKRLIDFEDGTDTDAIDDPLSDNGVGVTATVECSEGPNPSDTNCYYLGYGPPITGFVGKSVSGCGDSDTPETMVACSSGMGDAGELGFKGMTDEIDGPDDTDDVYITFSDAVSNPSIAIIDYRKDGGPRPGDRVTLSYFSGTSFDPDEELLGSWSYEVPGVSSPELDPDGKVVTLGPGDESITYTGVRAASITYSDGNSNDSDNNGRDVGLAWDNLMYFEVPTELGSLVNRFCTAGNRDANGDEAENFVPLDGNVYDPVFDPQRDCSDTESEGNAQFVSENAEPLEAVTCSNKKLTVGACEGGSNGNQQIQFSIGDNIAQLDPNGVQIEDSPATCRIKNGKLDCKASCTPAVHEAVSGSGEATVYADLLQFGSYTFGACTMRAK